MAIIVGVLFGERAEAVQPLGDVFLRLIQFIIVPLIFSTIIVGVTGSGGLNKLGRLGGKAISYFLITSFFAVALGLFAGLFFNRARGQKSFYKKE